MKHLILFSTLFICILFSCNKDSSIGTKPDDIQIAKRDIELKFITYSNTNKFGLSSNPVIYNHILKGNDFSTDTNMWNKRISLKHDTFFKYYYGGDSINFAFFNATNQIYFYDTTIVKIFFKDSLIYSTNTKALLFPSSPIVTKVIIPKK